MLLPSLPPPLPLIRSYSGVFGSFLYFPPFYFPFAASRSSKVFVFSKCIDRNVQLVYFQSNLGSLLATVFDSCAVMLPWLRFWAADVSRTEIKLLLLYTRFEHTAAGQSERRIHPDLDVNRN